MADDPWAEFSPQPAPSAAPKSAAPAADPWSEFNPQPAAKPKDRGVFERAGSAITEQAKSGVKALARPVEPFFSSEEENRKRAMAHRGLAGQWESFKEAGETLMSPLTIATAPLAGVESLAASGLGEAARLAHRGIKAGVEYFSPETAKKIRPEPTSEEAYEAMRPGVGMAMMALGRKPGVTATPRGSVLPDYVLPKTTKVPAKGAEAEAGRFLESQAQDPAALRAKLQQPPEEIAGPGDKPTTFEHTGDLGIAEQERAAARRPGQVSEYQQRNAERVQAQLKALEDLQPGGTPADVSAHLRRVMETENAEADRVFREAQQAGEQAVAEAQQRGQQGVEAAQEGRTQAVEGLGGTYDPTTSGNIMRRSLEDAHDVTRAYEREMWGRIDPNLPANPQPLQEVERRIYGVMREGGAEEASLSPAERQVTRVIQDMPPQGVPFNELKVLRSTISAELRKELVTNGQTPAYARLSQLRAGIEGAIADSVPPEVYAQVRAATQASAQRAQTFRTPGVKEVMRREGTQGPYRVGEATVPDQFIRTGPGGYDRASNYLRAVPTGLEEFADAVAAKARRTAINPDGTVNPRKLQTFLRQHQETLRAIDERDGGAFSQRLSNLGTAQEAMDAAEANRVAGVKIAEESQAAGMEAAKANQEAIAKKYKNDTFKALLGVDDDTTVQRVIGGIFGQHDAVPQAQELMRRLAGNKPAIEGARAAVVQHIRERLLTMASANEDPVFRSQQFQQWVARAKPALDIIMDPAQVQNLENISRSLQRGARLNQTKAKGGGSDTVQQWLADKQQQGAIREIAGKVAPHAIRAAVHSVAGVLGGWPGLIASGFGDAAVSRLLARRAAKQAATEQGRIQLIQDMVDDALLNPEKARQLLNKTHTYKDRTPGARSGVGYYGGVLSAEAERDKEKRLPREAGGGVPAIGGTGGRSHGTGTSLEISHAGKRTFQALQDGGTTGDQQASAIKPGTREHIAALLKGTPTTSSFAPIKTPQTKALSREDIRRTLQQYGISGEAAGSFSERQLGEHSVDSRARGGDVDPTETDEPNYGDRTPFPRPQDPGEQPPGPVDRAMVPGEQHVDPLGYRGERHPSGYYVTRGMAGGGTTLPVGLTQADVDQALRGPGWEKIRGSPENVAAQRYPDMPRINPERWDAAVASWPRSKNIEDRRQRRQGGGTVNALLPDALVGQTLRYVANQLAGNEDQHEPEDPHDAVIHEVGGYRHGHGEGGSDEGRVQLFADGGEVEEEKPPLPEALTEGYGERAAAQVRRRYPVREPDPMSLKASGVPGQRGMPFSHWLPSEERARAAAGALQRGEDYDPRDVLLSSVGLVGSPVAAPAVRGAGTVLGAGAARTAKPAAKAVEAVAPKAPEAPMLLGNPELRGSMRSTENIPFTYRGKGPAEWTPEEYEQVGKQFGVPRLGPESKPQAFNYEGGGTFNVPGGLEGEFTYYDLLRMKAEGIDPSRIPRDVHTQLHQKLMRSMDVPQPVSPERTWSGLMFGMTSPNNPLFPNQLTQSILRMRDPGLRQQLADQIPWRVGDKVSKEERLAASDRIADMFGLSAAGKGGLGIRGSTDYSRIGELAQMWEKDPQWFTKTAGESWPNYVERLTSQVTGTSMKTGSFGGVWQDPAHAGISAIDRHMINEFERTGSLFPNAAEKAAFEDRAVARWNNANQDRPVQSFRELEETSGGHGFLNKMKLEYVGAELHTKLRTPKGEINPRVPPHLANVNWPSEPTHVKTMGDAYRRALDWNQELATQHGLNLFPSQWLEWDRIRRRFEPHENMFPGLERMPAMSREQLRDVSAEHTASGHKAYNKVEGEEEGQMGLRPTRPRPNPGAFAYFTMPPIGAVPGSVLRLNRKKEP